MKVKPSGSSALRVKITGDKGFATPWYARHMGAVFDVAVEQFGHNSLYRVLNECKYIHTRDAEVVEGTASLPRNKYSREVKPGVWIDVYDVLRTFNVTDPCLQHLLKKALATGQRGHKSQKEDLQDILASAKRALEMHEEWERA